MGKFISVAKVSDFGEESKLVVKAGLLNILLVRSGQKIFALNNRCSHMGVSLFHGQVKEETIECPLHGMIYDLNTGEKLDESMIDPKFRIIEKDTAALVAGLGLPEIEKPPQQMYPVRIENEEIFVDIHPECQ